jgi:WD40 repeat protein
MALILIPSLCLGWYVLVRQHYHFDRISSLAFTPDGSTLVSGGYDGMVRLWDPTTGAERSPLAGFGERIFAVAVSPDGRFLATGGSAGAVRLLERKSGAVYHMLTWHDGGVTTLAFSPDGRTLASGGRDGHIRLWEVESGQPQRTLLGRFRVIDSVSFSPDGRLLAAGTVEEDRPDAQGMREIAALRVWKLTGEEDGRLVAHASIYRFATLGFTADSRTIIVGGTNGGIRAWDLATGNLQRRLGWHDAKVSSLTLSATGQALASGGYDRTVRLWDMLSARQTTTLQTAFPIFAVAFSPDGRTVAAGGWASAPQFWDVASGRPITPAPWQPISTPY